MRLSAALVRRLLRHPEGLLCALALDPSTLSRNRNFALYAATALRRVHSRARALRSLARAASAPAAGRTIEVERSGEAVRVVLRDASLALTRRVLLEPLELSVLKILVSRRAPQPDPALAPEPQDLQSASEALARIGLELDAAPGRARCA